MDRINRTKSQELIMQSLSSYLICNNANVPFDVENTLADICNLDYEDVPIYIKEVVIKSIKYQDEAVAYLSTFLKNWKFSRLNTCVQAILLMSYVNYKYMNDEKTDKGVIINVAVDLAKMYGENDNYKFVNAVLDNCLNESIK